MKITNKYNLPEPVYRLIAKDHYDGSGADYSVTQLIDSPRLVQLTKRHWDDIEEDAVDRIWSLFGSIAHNLLEQHGDLDNTITEERLFMKVRDSLISGKVDCYHKEPDGRGIITDYKVTSTWNVIYNSSLDKWTYQLNMYANLFRHNGYPVDGLRIVAILRDWQSSKAGEAGYPSAPIVIIPIHMYPPEEADFFMHHLVYEHEHAAKCTNDDDLPECTPEHTWEKATTYALKKHGRKTAIKVSELKEDLFEYLVLIGVISTTDSELPPEYYIETRPGERTRCEKYCHVSKFCNQYKAYKRSRT